MNELRADGHPGYNSFQSVVATSSANLRGHSAPVGWTTKDMLRDCANSSDSQTKTTTSQSPVAPLITVGIGWLLLGAGTSSEVRLHNGPSPPRRRPTSQD